MPVPPAGVEHPDRSSATTTPAESTGAGATMRDAGRRAVRYPIDRDLDSYIDDERGLGRFLDLGLIRPRLDTLYSWSAAELGLRELVELFDGGIPAYAWDSTDAEPWNPAPRALARTARRLVPPR
jgi:hypothetical protein